MSFWGRGRKGILEFGVRGRDKPLWYWEAPAPQTSQLSGSERGQGSANFLLQVCFLPWEMFLQAHGTAGAFEAGLCRRGRVWESRAARSWGLVGA